MGAWGHGIYDNDSALDILGELEYYTKLKLINKPNDIIKLIESAYDGYLNDNHCILVIAHEQVKRFAILTKECEKLYNDAMTEEFNMINDWKEPKLRKQKLDEFKSEIERLQTIK